MKLDRYLVQIGFQGRARPILDRIIAIHRAQVFSIPYENLDTQLSRRVDRDAERIFDKIDGQRRGEWCYELHELLLWALREIGFDARLVTAAIHRRSFGDVRIGDHTAILIRLERTYLADLGLGDGIRDPIPLQVGTYDQGRLRFVLERADGDYWRFRNHAFAYPTDVDFRDAPLDHAVVDSKADELQTNPESIFVQNLVCQIMQPESVTCLTGRVLRHKTPDGATKTLVPLADMPKVLAVTFGIEDAAMVNVLPKVDARHRALFGDSNIESIDVAGF